jgi:hypothetical protein
MKFYLVWDKTKESYVTTNNSYGGRTGSPRIYATHRHASAAATTWTPQSERIPVEGSDWPRHHYFTKEEIAEKRKELFEVHCYETESYEVVG